MVTRREIFFRDIADQDNSQILKLPLFLENYVKHCNVSELFRPLFARFVLFRFYRFQLARKVQEFSFGRIDPKTVCIPVLNDHNFDHLIGNHVELNLIFFEKDWYNINENKTDNFETFLKLPSLNSFGAVKLKQFIWAKFLKWPKLIKTDYSINSFTIFDILKGSMFLPSLKDKTIKKSVHFDNSFWDMALLDEFCFLIDRKDILLNKKSTVNKRKIISSKSYFNSFRARSFFIRCLGDDMSGVITRHGGIPSSVFTDEAFMANACNKTFKNNFEEKKFLSRYGEISSKNISNALVGLYDQSPFTCRFRTGMTRWQFLNEYVPDQRRLFELSKRNNYTNNLLYREPQRSLDPYLKTFNGVRKDTNSDIRQSLSENGLIIVTYDSSLPLFLITNDIPFFLFWRKEHWPFWSKSLYNFLALSGLYHETPETLDKCLIDFFSLGQKAWRQKYGNSAAHYKNFLRSEYIDQ